MNTLTKFPICICGKAGSGKDTLRQMLLDLDVRHTTAHQISTSKFAPYEFARPIKQALNTMFGWSNTHEWTQENKNRKDLLFGISPRYAAQTLGTEWGREYIGSDVWTKCATRYATRYPAYHLVISDMRFINELDWAVENNALIILLTRPETLRNTPDNAMHSSETSVDAIFDNVYGLKMTTRNPVNSSRVWYINNDKGFDKLNNYAAEFYSYFLTLPTN